MIIDYAKVNISKKGLTLIGSRLIHASHECGVHSAALTAMIDVLN